MSLRVANTKIRPNRLRIREIEVIFGREWLRVFDTSRHFLADSTQCRLLEDMKVSKTKFQVNRSSIQRDRDCDVRTIITIFVYSDNAPALLSL